MEKTKNFSLIVLIILAVGAFGYIGYDKYSDYKEGEQAFMFEQGAQYAIVQIAQSASTCNQVPLTVGNQTINLIAVECLQQAEAPVA